MAAPSFEGVQRVDVNGTTLAYREQGEGEPVVFVHGSASDMRTWQHQLSAMGQAHRAVIYSRRFARPNEPIPDGADDPMEPHVDDLVALLRALDATPAHVVGHSWGGFVALLGAIRHPSAMRSLVLMEPPVLPLFVSTPPKPPELVRLLFRRPRTALAIVRFGVTAAEPATKAFRRGDDEKGSEIFARGVLGPEAFSRLSAQRKAQAFENVAVDKAQLLGEGFPPLRDDEVRSVKTPTLLLRGERSPTLFRLLCEHLEELLPSARRVDVPGASHIMHEDNPGFVSRAIAEFVAEASQEASQASGG